MAKSPSHVETSDDRNAALSPSNSGSQDSPDETKSRLSAGVQKAKGDRLIKKG